jgi:HK97 family phage major capsid protein
MPQSTLEWRAEATAEELSTRAAEMRNEWATLSKSDRESDDFRNAKAQFLTEMEDLDVQLQLREMESRSSAGRRGPQIPDGAGGAPESGHRSIGRQVVEDEGFSAWQQGLRGTIKGQSPDVEVELRATVAENDANSTSEFLPVGQPYLVAPRRRRLWVRNLLDVQNTNLASIPYIREKNPATNETSASTVAEQATKPEATLEFTPDRANVEVIATTLPVTVQVVEDADTLMGYIDGRLMYMLDVREEDEVLRGNGIDPDLKGIMTYSDVQTQSTAGAGEYAITIGNAIAKVENVDGFADGVVMNPLTFWAMITHRAAGGSNASGGGNFDAAAFTSSPVQYVWGLPTVRSRSMNANQNLVGSFGLGATIFDRRQGAVRVFEQHSDFAVKNKVLLRAEKRIALAVHRPDFFCVATTS